MKTVTIDLNGQKIEIILLDVAGSAPGGHWKQKRTKRAAEKKTGSGSELSVTRVTMFAALTY